jgi:hypothetical protein
MAPDASTIVSSTVPVMPNDNKVVGLINGAWEELPALVNPNTTANIGGIEVLIGKSSIYVLGSGTSYYRFIKR